MKVSLEVIKCTESTQNAGTFYTKLVHKTTVETPFGAKESKNTFYVKGVKQMEVGSKVVVDMDMFIIKEHPATFADEKTGEMITRDLKWLHVKGAEFNVIKDKEVA